MTLDLKFLSSLGVNLDLAVEAQEIVRGQTGQEIPGVAMDKETYQNAAVTIVKIMEKSAEEIMGKPQGTYITIEAPVIKESNPQIHQEVVEVLAKHLNQLFNISPQGNVLVVGLGNWNATPDALGPRTIDQVMVTRHIFNFAPDEVHDGMRPVSAIAPGVLGITGIETAEIIKGIVDKIQPELIIAVDSLASRSVSRIATTIQIADTGIAPGSGIGNKRKGINQETMGVPVIAIGVPMVVHAAFIANDAIDTLFQRFQHNPAVLQAYQQQEVQSALNEILSNFGGQLMVTPKEIDVLIQNISKIVAGGITSALHRDISAEEYSMYLQ